MVAVEADEQASATSSGRTTWRSLFAVAEFRALWVAQAVSLLGDQLARVAIAWLVFRDTGSALLTAVVYAVTYLPWVIGGPLLGGLADRFPRRTVMVTCALLSAALVALLAVPGLPLPVLVGMLFLVVLLESPFLSARAALLVDVLPDDRYVLASGVGNVTSQAAQVLGFAGGGALVAAIGPRPALLLNAATFAFSALLVRVGTRLRPAPGVAAEGDGEVAGWLSQLRVGVRTVFGDPALRRLVLLAWLATFTVVPEGLAAPVADLLGGGAHTLGLLLAAEPAGAVVGALLVTRLVPPDRRLRLLVPLAVLTCAPVLAYAALPPLPVILAVLVVSGMGSSYQLVANATFMQLVPGASRGQAFSLAAAGLVAGQGLGLAVAGALTEVLSPERVVALSALLGLVLVFPLRRAGRATVARTI
jgi:MFS family permease